MVISLQFSASTPSYATPSFNYDDQLEAYTIQGNINGTFELYCQAKNINAKDFIKSNKEALVIFQKYQA